MPNALRERMASGQKTRAIWLETGSPVLAEAAIYAGFRFALIDNEHSGASFETTLHMVRAIEAAGGHAMVRTGGKNPMILQQLLDWGVSSFLVPRVETAEEAKALADICRYPPRGMRGFASEVRAAKYGLDAGYGDRAHDEVFLMLQIESAKGVENAEAIASTPGVDMIFPGPYDLSGSLGYRGQTGHPEVLAAIDTVKAAAMGAGRLLGTVPHGPHDVAALMDGGFALVIFGSDVGHAAAAMRDDAQSMPKEWL